MLHTYLDRTAITLSSICAIHCIALPIIAVMVPFFATTLNHGDTLHEFWFHQFILVFILPISLFALISGYRCHKTPLPTLLGGLGLIILISTALFAGTLISHHFIPYSAEALFTMLGGLIHAAGHISNVLATRSHHTGCVTN